MAGETLARSSYVVQTDMPPSTRARGARNSRAGRGRGRGTASNVARSLRDIDRSYTFEQPSATEQNAQTVYDQDVYHLRRKIPEHEVATLAINEIAASTRYGFFQHLPSRATWTSDAGEDRLPEERKPRQPESAYPTLIYYNYVWGKNTCESFALDNQRGRYLRASAINSSPPGVTPLYAVQYAKQKVPVFATIPDSIVLYATNDAFYVCRIKDAVRILGRDHDNQNKVGSANFLWDQASLNKGKDSDQRKQRFAAMAAYKQESLRQVYHEIVRLCRVEGGLLTATMTADELKVLIPRPASELAATIGLPLGNTGSSSADPTTRRGERRKRNKDDGGHPNVEAEAEEEEGQDMLKPKHKQRKTDSASNTDKARAKAAAIEHDIDEDDEEALKPEWMEDVQREYSAKD